MNASQFRLSCLVALTLGAVNVLPARPAPGDSALSIEQTVEPRFPTELAFSPISNGEARIIIHVGADGVLADLLVASYTHPAFAKEAVYLLRRWRYTPARENDEPIGIRMVLQFDFNATGRVVSLTSMDSADLVMSMRRQEVTNKVCPLQELDQPVAPLQPVVPYNPAQGLGLGTTRNSVLVDFYIDEYGQPRMPVVLSSPHEAFSQAAVGALNQWRFTPPTRSGRPVSVRVRQEFVFNRS